MKCQHCDLEISSKMRHALSKNECPGCGKQVLEKHKLTAYLSLQELLKSSFPDIDNERVANLVVANFELKQLFKGVEDKSLPSEPEVSTEEVSEEVEEDPDAEHKEQQMADAREKLKKMREDAYNQSLKDQFGMGDDQAGGLFLSEENVNMQEVVDRERKSQAQQNIVSGARGAFSRSDY